jgi:hypothetical protein
MSVFWEYFWPLVAFGLVGGGISGLIGFRQRRRSFLVIGAVVAVAGAALWHWPLGAADRLRSQVDTTARAVLIDWEMSQVQGRLHREPLTRRLMLSGRADDFQRAELVRIMSQVPGVSTATWSRRSGVPLIVEAAGAALLGFLAALLLAYVVELRRRHNAQWRW